MPAHPYDARRGWTQEEAMTDQLLASIRALAAEAQLHNDRAMACYRKLERHVDGLVALREPICELGIPQPARDVLRTALPPEETLAIVTQQLESLLMTVTTAVAEEVAVAHPPTLKSWYAVYEKLIDGRHGRRGGLPLHQKVERARRFAQLLPGWERRGYLRAVACDLVRSRLVATTREHFRRLVTVLPEHAAAAGFAVVETRSINVGTAGDTLSLPRALDTPAYVALHFKLMSERVDACGAEVQVRIARNHWGPHMRVTANGYLNKYLAPVAEEVDYTKDWLALRRDLGEG